MSVVDTSGIDALARAQRIPKSEITNAIAATLADRKSTHGEFTDHAAITQAIKRVIADSPSARAFKFSAVAQEALEMIAHKIGRICAGNPNHADHWRDIAGYARLVEERLS